MAAKRRVERGNDVVFLAALVVMAAEEKARVVEDLGRHMTSGAGMVVQNAHGARGFVYPVVDPDPIPVGVASAVAGDSSTPMSPGGGPSRTLAARRATAAVGTRREVMWWSECSARGHGGAQRR